MAELAAHADASEVETAQAALELARAAARRSVTDPRLQRRLSHIGYYLFEQGGAALERRIGYHVPALERFRRLLLTNNEEFYILGIFVLSLVLIVALIAPLVPRHTFGYVIGALFLALLPATQGAADLVNNTGVGVAAAAIATEARSDGRDPGRRGDAGGGTDAAAEREPGERDV